MATKRTETDRLEVMIDKLNREVEKLKERLEKIEAVLTDSIHIHFGR